MYLGDNLLQGGIVELVERFRDGGADALILLTAGPRPASTTASPSSTATASCAWSRSRRSPRSDLALVGVYMFTAGDPRRRPRDRAERARRARDHRRDPAPDRRRPARRVAHRARLVEGHRPARRHARGQPADPRHDRGALRRRARSTRSSTAASSSTPGARLERSTVRGPAIIGAGARLDRRLRRPLHRDRRGLRDRVGRGRALDPPRRLRGPRPRRCAIESSLLRPQRADRPRRAPAARLPLHARRQLRGAGARDARARDRRRRDARPRRRRRGARRAGTTCVALGRAELDVTDAGGGRGGGRRARARRDRQLRRLDRRRRRRGATRRRRFAVNGDGAGNLAARRRARPAPRLVHVSTDYVFDGDRARPYVESDPTGAAAPPTGAPSSPASRPSRGRQPAPRVVRSAWLFGIGGAQLRRARCSAAPPAASARSPVVRDQVGCPTYTWHLADELLDLADRRARSASSTWPPPASCSWYEFAREIFDAGRRRVQRSPRRPARRSAARRRGPAWSVLGSEREHAIRCRPGTTGSPRYLAQRRQRLRAMKLLVCGGAGFIGSNFVRMRAARRATTSRRARQADLRRPAREPARRRGRPALLVRTRRDRGPDASREALDGVDAIVNFAAETHVDRSIDEPDAFARTHALGTVRAARGRPRARHLRYLQVSTDEVYGSIAEGSFTETSPLRPLLALLARPRPARDLLVGAYSHTFGLDALICRGSNNYGPAPVPGEADPADGAERARTATGCRSTATASTSATGSTSRTSPRAIAHGARPAAAPARSTTSAAPTSARTSRSCRRILELCGRDESLIEYVTDRPGHDRRYSLGSEKVQRARLGGRGRTSTRASSGPSPGTATTPGGGSRSAPAPTASTTSASTGARSAERAAQSDGRSRQPAGCVDAAARSLIDLLAVDDSSARVAVARRAGHVDRLDRQREVVDRLELVGDDRRAAAALRRAC